MRSDAAGSTPALRYGLAGAVVLGVIAWFVHGPDAPAERAATTKAARAPVAGAATACAVDPRCAAEQALAVAGPACSHAIAQLAAYGVRWTTSDASGRFPRRAWRDGRPGTIRYGGDSAEFEDGSGHYRRVRYECDFDPGQRAVLDLAIRPG